MAKIKQKEIKQQDCVHDWKPIAIDTEYCWVIVHCWKCKEYAWDDIKPLEWKENL